MKLFRIISFGYKRFFINWERFVFLIRNTATHRNDGPLKKVSLSLLKITHFSPKIKILNSFIL